MNSNKNQEKLTGDELIRSLLNKISPADHAKNATRMRISSVIAEQLVHRGLSKRQFAEMINKEPSVISKWLSGTHNFTVDTLCEIGLCLNIAMPDFFKEPEETVLSAVHFAVLTPPAIPNKFSDSMCTAVNRLSNITSKQYHFNTKGLNCLQDLTDGLHLNANQHASLLQVAINGDEFAVSKEKVKASELKSLSKL